MVGKSPAIAGFWRRPASLRGYSQLSLRGYSQLSVVSRRCKGSWPCAEMGVFMHPSRKDHELVPAYGLAA
jgi:hypothetical protein